MKSSSDNPGIAVAWFGGVEPYPFSQYEIGQIFENPKAYERDVLPEFIDFTIQGGRDWERAFGVRFSQFPTNPGIVSAVLEAGIVIEQSPPTLADLKSLASHSPALFIGTYIGMGLSGGSYPLMLVTVPAGIIVIGSAVGVAQALQKGLNISIEKAFKGRSRR